MNIRKLFSSQFLQSLRNAGWMFFDRVFRMFTGFFVSIWLARYLGPDQYGLLNYVYVFPLALSALVSLGLNTLLISEIPLSLSSSDQTDRLVLTSVALKLSAGVIAFSLVVTANYQFHQSSQTINLITISAIALLFQGFDTIDVYFQSIQKVRYSILPKVIAFLLAVTARTYGLTQGFGLSFFVIVTVAEVAVSYSSICFIYLWHRQLSSFRWPFDMLTARRLLWASWPIMAAEFFIFAYMRLDQFMIKHLANSNELGQYSAALRVSEAWYFVAGAITTSFYPAIIALRSSNNALYLQQFQSLLNALATIGISISLLFIMVAEPVAHLLYGSQYTGVGPILSLHIWTGVFVFLSIGANNWFVVERLQRLLLWRAVAGALLNALLNVVLIPKYGALGASFATLIAQGFATYLINLLLQQTKEIFELQTNALLFLPRQLISFCRRA